MSGLGLKANVSMNRLLDRLALRITLQANHEPME